MIFITGDKHRNTDRLDLDEISFKKQTSLTKSDYVIICGDFGGVWNGDGKNSDIMSKVPNIIPKEARAYYGNDDEILDWYEGRSFTTLFVDGNHENHDLLSEYPVENWHGGKIHRIRENVIHLMRGQIFQIEGKSFFTLGGANSKDRDFRINKQTWWAGEELQQADIDESLDNLEKNNWTVDYVLTHCAPVNVEHSIDAAREQTPHGSFLFELDKRLDFTQWYFGHYHTDHQIDNLHTAVYRKILQITE